MEKPEDSGLVSTSEDGVKRSILTEMLCELPVSVFDAKFRGAKSLGWWVRTGAALGKRGLVVPRHPIGRVRGEGGGVAL